MDKLKYFSPVMLAIDDDEDPDDTWEGSSAQGGDAGKRGDSTKITNDFSGS